MKQAYGAFALGLALAAAGSALAQSDSERTRRPRIVITPQQGYTVVEPPPTAKRQCRSWLAQEYRPSGTVIVPQMQCWWQ